MAAITLADVQDICPEVTRVSATWLTWVNTKILGDTFDGEDGVHTKLVRSYLLAHFMLMIDIIGGSASGPVSSESEGGISRAYAVGDVSASALQRTGPGAQALFLMRMYIAGPRLAREC